MAAVLRTRGLSLSLKQPLRSLWLLLPLWAPAYPGFAQTPLDTAHFATSSHALTIELHPREYTQIGVALTGGKYNEIRIESPGSWSRGVFLKAVPGDSVTPSPLTDPYISDSGESFVRIPKNPEHDEALHLQLTALSNSKGDTRPVTATITVLVEDSTAQTALTTKALDAFIHAERIRRDRGKAEIAVPAYDEALAAARELKDQTLQQRILLSKARFLDLDGRHYADAVAYAKQATEVDSGAAPSVRGMAWKTLGSAAIDMDRYEEGIAASRRAADLFREAGDTFWLGIVLENLGEAYQTSGNLAAALTTDTEALRIARDLKDDYGIIEMLSEIGAIHKDRAEYQEALNDFSAAVELTLPSSFNPMQAEAWTHLGELYTILGEADQALPAYEHALSIAQSTRNGIAELETLRRIAELQLNEKPKGSHTAEAQQSFTRALARAQELKLTRQQSALLIGLARSEVMSGNYAAAQSHLQQALHAAADIHQTYEQADARDAEAELAEAQGHRSEAASELKESNALWESLPDDGRLAQGLSRLAELYIEDGRLDLADASLRRAITLIETSRGSIARGSLRTQYFALQHHTYDLAVYTAMQLNREHPDAGYAARAWQVAESARARTLLDSLAGDDASVDDPAKQPLRERLAALGNQIADTQDKIAALGTTAADLEKAAQLQQSLHQSLTEEQQLEARLAPVSAATASTGTFTPASFAHEALTPGTALLEYWEGERASYVWLIGQDGRLQAATLPPASQLKERVSDYAAELLARNSVVSSEDFARRSQRLAAADTLLLQRGKEISALLLPPSIHKQLAADDTLLIVPDGSLLSVPFAALVEPTGRQYLIQKFRLVTEPSAAAAAALAPLPKNGGANRVAVFADPVYSRSDGRFQTEGAAPPLAENATRGVSGVDLSQLPRLPGSRQEALAIAAVAGPGNVSLHLGFEATPATVKALDWKSYSVAHFAAHAVASGGMPGTSGIVLSMVDSSGKSVDGMLWLRDIQRLHLAQELVVLSGCGTALGENIPGEGLNSLSRAFLEAGTRDVTATLWNADDAMSSRLMQSFYRGFLEQRMSAPAALRTAQLQMLDDPRHRSPYYWAGFTMEGAWQAR